jgi:hypothetical protein
MLLLRTCLNFGGEDQPTETAQRLLGEQFVDPVRMELVGNVREVFGIQEGGTDTLSTLISATDGDDD